MSRAASRGAAGRGKRQTPPQCTHTSELFVLSAIMSPLPGNRQPFTQRAEEDCHSLFSSAAVLQWEWLHRRGGGQSNSVSIGQQSHKTPLFCPHSPHSGCVNCQCDFSCYTRAAAQRHWGREGRGHVVVRPSVSRINPPHTLQKGDGVSVCTVCVSVRVFMFERALFIGQQIFGQGLHNQPAV